MFISIVQELLPYLFYASVIQASQNNEKEVYVMSEPGDKTNV